MDQKDLGLKNFTFNMVKYITKYLYVLKLLFMLTTFVQTFVYVD